MQQAPLFPGTLVAALLAVLAVTAPAQAACGASALGTERTLTLPREAAAYGRAQHGALPLGPREVVLTFDDGPRPETTPRVLQALADECVRATFFMNGEPMLRHPALARQVQAAGHTVAMHSMRHDHFGQLSETAQLQDLRAMQETMRQVLGAPAAAWRFPYLEETQPLRAALKAQGLTLMSVDLDIADWLPGQTPALLAQRLEKALAASGGGIILMHDAEPQTAEALPLLLRTLKAGGWRVVHLQWP